MGDMDRMIAAVSEAGSRAYGNEALGAVAQEWIDAGFDEVDAAQWLGAGCFDANTAAELRKAGVTPEQAAVHPSGDDLRRVGARVEGYGESIGYMVANGDLSTACALRLVTE